jgi:hypothetical protein
MSATANLILPPTLPTWRLSVCPALEPAAKAAGLALALAGCGPGNGLTMGRVSGVVTYKGEPVKFGEVLFVPDSDKGNSGVPSMGRIEKDGRSTMSTQDPGDGVIAGHHELGIRALDPEPVAKEEESTPGPGTATGKQLMEDRLHLRKDQSLSRRKNRAKEDAPTVSFGGKVDRFRASQDLANPEKSGIRVQINRGSNRVDVDIAEDGTVEVTQ